MEKKNNFLKLENLALLLLVAVAIFNLDKLGAFFSGIFNLFRPFVYGAVVAYILCPLCGKIEKWLLKITAKKRKKEHSKLWRNLSILISFLLFFLIIGLVIYMIVPQLIVSVTAVVANLPDMIVELEQMILRWLQQFPEIQHQIESLTDTLVARAGSLNFESILQNIVTGVSDTLGNVYDTFIGIIFAFYLMGNTKKLKRQGKEIVYACIPKKWANLFFEELHFADQMFSGFLVGKIIDSAIIGVLAYILFLIFRVDNSVLMAAIIGVTNIIPFFGPIIGAVPCALLALVDQGFWFFILVLILVLALQQFDGNILGPRVLGQAVGLSSMWVFFAIVFFGDIWGVPGMILGVPLFAVIYDMIRKAVRNRNVQPGAVATAPEAPTAQPGAAATAPEALTAQPEAESDSPQD